MGNAKRRIVRSASINSMWSKYSWSWSLRFKLQASSLKPGSMIGRGSDFSVPGIQIPGPLTTVDMKCSLRREGKGAWCIGSVYVGICAPYFSRFMSDIKHRVWICAHRRTSPYEPICRSRGSQAFSTVAYLQIWWYWTRSHVQVNGRFLARHTLPAKKRGSRCKRRSTMLRSRTILDSFSIFSACSWV